jgi:hypothetical protein
LAFVRRAIVPSFHLTPGNFSSNYECYPYPDFTRCP